MLSITGALAGALSNVPMNRLRRVTINDVADEAGVSIKTVSRVLNDRPDVAPETRKKVKEIIRRLGYQPSKLARGLSQGRSGTIGVISYGVKYFGPSSTLSGVEEMSYELGYTVIWEMLRDSKMGDVQQLLQDMLSHHVDGIFWAVPEIPYTREWIIQALAQLSIPVVINMSQPTTQFSTVSNKNEEGGHLATAHLLEQNRRHIGLVAGPLDWRESRLRKRGWEKALSDAGQMINDEFIFEGDWSAESGAQGFQQLISQHPELDAIFCSNDQMAMGVLRMAYQAGIRVPQDLAVVGYDDYPESKFTCPSLTTIHQETFEMGRWAIKELLRLIEAAWTGKDVKPNTVAFEPQLIVRESSVIDS